MQWKLFYKHKLAVWAITHILKIIIKEIHAGSENNNQICMLNEVIQLYILENCNFEIADFKMF